MFNYSIKAQLEIGPSLSTKEFKTLYMLPYPKFMKTTTITNKKKKKKKNNNTFLTIQRQTIQVESHGNYHEILHTITWLVSWLRILWYSLRNKQHWYHVVLSSRTLNNHNHMVITLFYYPDWMAALSQCLPNAA